MDKENVMYTHNRILFSHKKRRKSCNLQQHGLTSRALCYNTNTVCSHLHAESERAELVEIETRMVVARGWVEIGRCWFKRYKLPAVYK